MLLIHCDGNPQVHQFVTTLKDSPQPLLPSFSYHSSEHNFFNLNLIPIECILKKIWRTNTLLLLVIPSRLKFDEFSIQHQIDFSSLLNAWDRMQTVIVNKGKLNSAIAFVNGKCSLRIWSYNSAIKIICGNLSRSSQYLLCWLYILITYIVKRKDI